MEKMHIIGLGEAGLAGVTDQARQIVRKADLLIGDAHVLELVGDARGERLPIDAGYDVAVKRIREAGDKKVVVLASGDPFFYGIARYLVGQLGKERFEVLPHVSSMQLAFARVKESWEDAYLTNLASRPLESIIDAVRVAEKVGLFTSDHCTPADVARGLLDRGIDYFFGYVCENLGTPDERVTRGELADLAEQSFSPLNVLVLVRRPDTPDKALEASRRRLFGNPDEVFLQSTPKRGLLTPAEVRSIALAEMGLARDSIVWDIGAGSGSVSVEAAQLAPAGKTYAIELDPEDHRLIVANAERFGVTNLIPVLGRAPEAWANLPDPHAVFVGGTGREVGGLILAVYDRLRPGGRLVANVGSIENLAEVHQSLQRRQLDVQVWMVNVARGTHQLERVRFAPLQPTFLLAVEKT